MWRRNVITTTKGLMDEALLEKRTGVVDNDNEHTTWVEYWLAGELVHRSAHVRFKTNVFAEPVVEGFRG